MVPISSTSLPTDRDFLFEPVKQVNLSLFAHLVDYDITAVLAKNDSDYPIQIPYRLRLSSVVELDYENCFQINMEPELAKTPPKVG